MILTGHPAVPAERAFFPPMALNAGLGRRLAVVTAAAVRLPSVSDQGAA